MQKYMPLLLDFSNKRCFVFGGGKAAKTKALKLMEFGAKVYVVSPKISFFGGFTAVIGKYKSYYLNYADFVVAATDDDALNKIISDDCFNKHIFCLNTSDSSIGNAQFMSCKSIDGVLISLTTQGKCPFIAKMLLEGVKLPISGDKLKILSDFRKKVLNNNPSFALADINLSLEEINGFTDEELENYLNNMILEN